MENKTKKIDWDELSRLEQEAMDATGGVLACNPEMYKKMQLLEDEWMLTASALEDGCSVTAGSIDPAALERFYIEVEENKVKVNQMLDDMGVKKI